MEENSLEELLKLLGRVGKDAKAGKFAVADYKVQVEFLQGRKLELNREVEDLKDEKGRLKKELGTLVAEAEGEVDALKAEAKKEVEAAHRLFAEATAARSTAEGLEARLQGLTQERTTALRQLQEKNQKIQELVSA